MNCKLTRIDLYPTENQKKEINNFMGTYRFIYNVLIHNLKHCMFDDGRISSFHCKRLIDRVEEDERYKWLSKYSYHLMIPSITALIINVENFVKDNGRVPSTKDDIAMLSMKKKEDELRCCCSVPMIQDRDDYVNITGLGMIKSDKHEINTMGLSQYSILVMSKGKYFLGMYY